MRTYCQIDIKCAICIFDEIGNFLPIFISSSINKNNMFFLRIIIEMYQECIRILHIQHVYFILSDEHNSLFGVSMGLNDPIAEDPIAEKC